MVVIDNTEAYDMISYYAITKQSFQLRGPLNSKTEKQHNMPGNDMIHWRLLPE